MTQDQLMDALTRVKENFIMEAAPGKRKRKKTSVPWLAAAGVLLAMLVFFQTSPGAKALETVTGLIESLFPPKEIPIVLEGETEVISHEAGGQVPSTEADGTVTAPGFAIYYDPESYVMTQDEDVTYIRCPLDGDFPPVELEIRHLPGVAPAQAAEAAHAQMAETWDTVGEISPWETPQGIYFFFYDGLQWDSACGDICFFSDGQDGSFQIISRYFLEATEGHGSRFAQMIQTFTVIEP